ncbi:MAG TPA: DUF928 domain-containing protein [Nostocaceae cyanobacterium]|nr:DUF928 domain-containing protein [Nostocaceae cyanobacterium]
MKTKLLKSSILSLLFTLPLSTISLPVQAQTFKPPKRPGPPVSVGAATRGNSCVQGNKNLTPLIPKNKLGLTISERPTFFWYTPESPAKTAQFVLKNQDNKIIYETTLSLPNQSGIMGFTLPINQPALEENKTYRWDLILICDEDDFSNNPRINGWVERVQPDTPLSQALEKADFRKFPGIYAEAGIWHEALISLVELRLTEPNNLTNQINWRQFLKSVGLQDLASEPLVKCCTANN